MAQLVGCLPGTHKVLGSMLSTTHTGDHKFEVILGDRVSLMTNYMRPCFKKGEAEEMAKCIKPLQFKNEDINSDPKNLLKIQVWLYTPDTHQVSGGRGRGR